MSNRALTTALLAAVIAAGTISAARADCESDLLQLEQAFNAPSLTAQGKAALDDAKTKAVSALRKDDDAACHQAIAEALPKAGIELK